MQVINRGTQYTTVKMTNTQYERLSQKDKPRGLTPVELPDGDYVVCNGSLYRATTEEGTTFEVQDGLLKEQNLNRKLSLVEEDLWFLNAENVRLTNKLQQAGDKNRKLKDELMRVEAARKKESPGAAETLRLMQEIAELKKKLKAVREDRNRLIEKDPTFRGGPNVAPTSKYRTLSGEADDAPE